MSLEKGLPAKFTHIYIEKGILNRPEVNRICSFFPNAVKIPIDQYTNIFDRRRQSYSRQHMYQNLILAEKKERFIYPGSPVCQDFAYDNFYYCAPVMNCIYDCEYCWLKGMYPSGYLVVFVNQDDFFESCRNELQKHPLYLCISFDADLLSLEPLLGYVKRWTHFVENNKDITIEVRTKAASYQNWVDIPVNDRVIYAFTLSPDEVIERYEHGTPSLDQRLNAVQACLRQKRKVRLCIDPMIPIPYWENAYKEMLEKITAAIDLKQIKDISVGSFRISSDYLKKMRHEYPDSAVIQYPYIRENGFYHLPYHLNEKMENTMVEMLEQYIDSDRIYTWEDFNG